MYYKPENEVIPVLIWVPLEALQILQDWGWIEAAQEQIYKNLVVQELLKAATVADLEETAMTKEINCKSYNMIKMKNRLVNKYDHIKVFITGFQFFVKTFVTIK